MLKDKHEKDTKERKVEEKTLLENIKASIDPILKSDHKTSDHIGIGAQLKHLQEEVTNYLPPTPPLHLKNASANSNLIKRSMQPSRKIGTVRTSKRIRPKNNY